MRTLLFIMCSVLLGCRHTSPERLPYDPDAHIAALQKEIAILEREVTQLRRDPEVHFGQREREMQQARESYSRGQRLRDTRTMIEILERRKAALSAESRAFHDGKVYDKF